jgi:thiamine-phosphate pyrophosphorylase
MKQLLIPAVYPITDVRLSGLSHAEQVRQLVEAGATLIQLREKHNPPKTFYPDAKAAIEFAHQNNAKIIVNDRVDIALALDADGVHLGQDDLPPAEARKLLGPDRVIGFSTHSIEQAKAALRRPIDYIAVGPVFGTNTKEKPDPTVGLDVVRQIRELIGGDLPLVAIGGIDHTTIASVIASGATSAAVIGSLFADGRSIGDNYRRLSSAELRQAVRERSVKRTRS